MRMAISAWAAENTSVRLERIPWAFSIETALKPASVAGSLITKLEHRAAIFSPSATIAFQSLWCGLTSTETVLSVPAINDPISCTTLMNGLPDACTCRGLVVTPSRFHMSRAYSISFTMALSKKNFIYDLRFQDLCEPAGSHKGFLSLVS